MKSAERGCFFLGGHQVRARDVKRSRMLSTEREIRRLIGVAFCNGMTKSLKNFRGLAMVLKSRSHKAWWVKQPRTPEIGHADSIDLLMA